ncbi:putative histone H5 [Rosa chinensis]|uniref:Putative histone H5 n=1 Tax=Rosa chinensis TaxID=74649 RepID=A0A2P6RLY3_ROSCH|nr:histone H1 [Rosa chinensis]PRQ47438.1 putative histone H5 [Rosa chinensis]
MSATEEVEAPTVEAPPATEEKPVREKKLRDLKEKKPKQPKTKTKPKTAAHPPYFQMIKEALLALNEKSGSSPYAIAKYMEEKHKAVLPANFKKTLALQLKNSEARGKLVKVKASYKLSEAGKKDKSASKRTTRASKPKEEEEKIKTKTKTKTKVSAAPKVTKKKPAKKNKKSSAAKPKQPKSIKSPAAKKPKKAAA